MHPRSAEEHLALVAATGEVPVYNVAENGVDGGGKEIERGEVRVDPGGASVLLISWAKTRHAVVSFGEEVEYVRGIPQSVVAKAWRSVGACEKQDLP